MSNLVVLSEFEDSQKEFPEVFEAYMPFAERLQANLAIAKATIDAHLQDPQNEDLWADARKVRLVLRKNRISLDKERKELKESAKRYADAVDSPARELRKIHEEQEEALLKIEKYEEEQRMKERIALEKERKQTVADVGGDPDHYPALADMTDDTFEAVLLGIQAKIEQEARAKAEAEARAKAEAEARKKELAEARAKAEEERKRGEIRTKRMAVLARLGIYQTKQDVADMTEEQWAENLEKAHAWAGKQAKVKAEEDAKRKEEERVQAIKAEETRKKAEAEAKAKVEEEARRKAEADKAYQVDKASLQAFLAKLEDLREELPDMKTKQGQKDSLAIQRLLNDAIELYK